MEQINLSEETAESLEEFRVRYGFDNSEMTIKAALETLGYKERIQSAQRAIQEYEHGECFPAGEVFGELKQRLKDQYGIQIGFKSDTFSNLCCKQSIMPE